MAKCKHVFMSKLATPSDEMECRVCGKTEKLSDLTKTKDGTYAVNRDTDTKQSTSKNA